MASEPGLVRRGYHFVIRGQRRIERGRPEGNRLSQWASWNGDNIGIVLTGNFETGSRQQPNRFPAMAAKRLFIPQVGVKPVIGHKDVMATAKRGETSLGDLKRRLEEVMK